MTGKGEKWSWTGTHLKKDRCVRLPETWKNQSLPKSFLESHTEMNMLGMMSCKCHTNKHFNIQCGQSATFPPLGSPLPGLLGPVASPGLALGCINFKLSADK